MSSPSSIINHQPPWRNCKTATSSPLANSIVDFSEITTLYKNRLAVPSVVPDLDAQRNTPKKLGDRPRAFSWAHITWKFYVFYQ
jgi:hypothetical protein